MLIYDQYFYTEKLWGKRGWDHCSLISVNDEWGNLNYSQSLRAHTPLSQVRNVSQQNQSRRHGEKWKKHVYRWNR